MAICMVIARKDIEAVAKRFDVTDYTAETFDWSKHSPNVDMQRDDVLFRFAVGRVVSLREMNGYHDSDFYATYQSDHGFNEIEYATTRGWTYANGASIDATPEVAERYTNMLARAAHRSWVIGRWMRRNRRRDALAAAKISLRQYNRLRHAVGNTEADALVKLLSQNLRNKFRISCAEQVRGWLNTDTPKYNTPLSRKQLDYILGR